MLMHDGRTLKAWQEFARTDNCLDKMVPSDLRTILMQVADYEALQKALVGNTRLSAMQEATKLRNLHPLPNTQLANK